MDVGKSWRVVHPVDYVHGDVSVAKTNKTKSLSLIMTVLVYVDGSDILTC